MLVLGLVLVLAIRKHCRRLISCRPWEFYGGTIVLSFTLRGKPSENHYTRTTLPYPTPTPSPPPTRSQVLKHKFRVRMCLASSKLLNAFLVNMGLLVVMHILNTRVALVLEDRSPLPSVQVRKCCT